MTQLSLDFTLSPPRVTKRVSVPATSGRAYREKREQIGARGDRVLAYLRCSTIAQGAAPTSAEVAGYEMSQFHPAWEAHKLYVRRGLSDLLAAGWVQHGPARPCRVGGMTCVTWRLR
jgi:hypothetical protein